MRKALSTAFVTLILAAAFACSERSAVGPDPDTNPPPGGLNVSEPGKALSTNLLEAQSASLNSVATEVAYVSAVLGTIPSGLLVKIRDVSSGGATVTANVVDGGFDPVAIPAVTGDNLNVSVITFAREVISYAVSVPPRRPPIIVRTNPANGRVDVALTQVLTVVFSEPVDSRTVNGASMRLEFESEPISGNVTLAQDGLSASLAPNAPLQPATTYKFVITRQIRDLEGDALDLADTVVFTTATSSQPSGPSVPAGPSNIRLVFQRVDDGGAAHLYTINGDGSGLRQLTPGNSDGSPAVSPDGTQIAFACGANICVMNSDGSGIRQVATDGGGPDWSPDGKKIVFTDQITTGISVISADGTGLVHLTTAASQPNKVDGQASWSPDGKQITFWRWEDMEFSLVWVMNSDGTGARRLGRQEPFGNGTRTWACWGPIWSADSRIVFVGPDDSFVATIFSMNDDGSGVATVTRFTTGFLSSMDDRSADGTWMTFTGSERGPTDVYLLKGGSIFRVTNDGRSSNAAFLSR